MTTTTHGVRPSTLTGPATICLWAGLLGAASGVFLAFVPPQVADPDLFNYPLGDAGFTVIQLFFVVQHVGLILGVVALARSGVAGRERWAGIGFPVTIASLGLLTVTEAVCIGAAGESAASGGWATLLNTLYGVSSIGSGVGLILVGVATLRAHRWTDGRRWLPLAMGVWVFVPMTPAMLAGFVPARLGITGWMLLFAALGWVLMADQRQAL